MNSKFLIVAPLGSISKRVRLFKLTKFLYSQGCDKFTHWGWLREKGEGEHCNLPFVLDQKYIIRGGGYGSWKNKVMYIVWIVKLFFRSFTISHNTRVWALGFESAFPLLIASKIRGYKVFFDDADRFSMLMSFPKPLALVIEYFEKGTSRHVYKHVIPVKERYNFDSDRFYILSNTPSESELVAAHSIFKEREWITAKIVININGWLGEGRGMDIALMLYEELEDEDIAFILAGKLDCEAAKILSQKPKVQYLGHITNAEALASYLASDFVFTYYNPQQKINLYAASNKWGDAIKTGTGIIVNSEIKTAKDIIDKGITISYNYQDVSGLVDRLRQFCLNDSAIAIVRTRLKEERSNYKFFEQQLEKLFNNESE